MKRRSAHRAAAFLIRGDARALPLRDRSVQCVVTSPPYWGLRDYGRAKQMGLEATPDAYVAALVAVFREVRRVLKDDGTVWLNLGDSYATGAGKVGSCPGGGTQGARWAGHSMTDGTNSKEHGRRADRMFRGRGMNTKDPKWAAALGPINQPNRMPIAGLKPKDLVMIPARVALALQADGWYLRADIIWHKPNPMPESVTDRPTKAHEHLFLLTKSEKYSYDAAAISEPLADGTVQRHASSPPRITGRGLGKDAPKRDRSNSGGFPIRKSGNVARKYGESRGRPGSHLGASIPWEGSTRNKRSVWTINTQSYKGAHFATMPEKLVEPCILAGSQPGDVCLDPFVGSGTVAAVAQRLGRRGVGVDLRYQNLAKVRTRAPVVLKGAA